jgi:hypothetical protein
MNDTEPYWPNGFFAELAELVESNNDPLTSDRLPRPLGRVGLGLLDVYPYMDQSRPVRDG